MYFKKSKRFGFFCHHQLWTFFNFRKIANQENEEIYIILFVKELWTSYLRKSTHKVGKHFKKCVWKKIPLIFYWFLFVFYIHNSLEKQTENSGVLLNCRETETYLSGSSDTDWGVLCTCRKTKLKFVQVVSCCQVIYIKFAVNLPFKLKFLLFGFCDNLCFWFVANLS